MPSLIDAISQLENSIPTIELRTDIVLFKFATKERAKPTARMKAQGIEEGNPFLKGTFVGEDEKANLTCQKVLNVFFANNKDMITFTGNGDDVEGLGSSALIFLMGQLSFNDIEVDGKLEANQSYSLAATSICRYNLNGEFYYSEEGKDGKLKSKILKGTPGAVVSISLERSGVMNLAPKLDPAKKPKKSPIKVSRNPIFGKPQSTKDDDFEIKSEDIQTEKAGEAVSPDEAKVPAMA
jgi:hypothetical protein